jgi:hypothetical protein
MNLMHRLTRAFGPQPLAGLARTHAVGTAADACIAVALAGTLFFGVSADAARSRVGWLLLLSLAPFAAAIAFVRRTLTRRERTTAAVLVLTLQARAALAIVLAFAPLGLVLHAAAFGVLMLGRGYAITKRSLVPALVASPHELVAANARLARIGTVSGALGGAVGAACLHFAGSAAPLFAAAAGHALASLLARDLRGVHTVVRDTGEHVASRAVGRMRAALFGMAMLRAASGLVAFAVAFSLKEDGAPAYLVVMAALALPAGALAGTVVSPRLRAFVGERTLVCLSTIVGALATAAAASIGLRVTAMIALAVLALAASVGRHAFDSLVQCGTDCASRSHVFGRIEAALQLAWVVGALGATTLAFAPWAACLASAVVLALSTIVSMRSLDGHPRARRVRRRLLVFAEP